MARFGEIAPDARRTEEQIRAYGYLGVERRQRASIVSLRGLACLLGGVVVGIVLTISLVWRG